MFYSNDVNYRFTYVGCMVSYSLKIKIRTSGENITSLQRNLIKDLVRRKLVGVETISDSENEIVLQTLVSYPELRLKTL